MMTSSRKPIVTAALAQHSRFAIRDALRAPSTSPIANRVRTLPAYTTAATPRGAKHTSAQTTATARWLRTRLGSGARGGCEAAAAVRRSTTFDMHLLSEQSLGRSSAESSDPALGSLSTSDHHC